MFWRLVLVLLPCLALSQTQPTYSAHKDIKTGIVQLWNNNNPAYNSSTVPVSYNITFGVSLTGVKSIGIGIVGLMLPISNDFSPNVTTSSFTVSGFRVSFQVYNGTILTFFSINYLAIGPTLNFAQLLKQCFLCSTLSIGSGTRIQSRSLSTSFTAKSLVANAFLHSFQLHNSQGLSNILYLDAKIPTSSSTVGITFRTEQANLVISICYSVVVFYKEMTQIYFKEFGQIGTTALSYTANPSNIVVHRRYKGPGNMFFGISGFNLSRTTTRLFSVQTSQVLDLSINYQSNYGTHQVLFSYFFNSVISCNQPPSPYYDVYQEMCVASADCTSGTTHTNFSPYKFCYNCSYTCPNNCSGSLYNNCSGCNTSVFRYSSTGQCLCQSGYLDIGVEMCSACSNLIPGCDKCSSKTVCTNCLSGFVSNSASTCDCTSGLLVSGICISIIGCTSAISYNGNVSCLSCNQTLHFNRSSNFSCLCTSGFVLNSNLVCSSVCGDGIVVEGEECDDHNDINGDGCSVTCRIQTGWSCVNSPSFCTIVSNPVLNIRYVRRNTNSNEMEVALQITPVFALFSNINFQQFISHNIPSSNNSAVYMGNGILLLKFAYNQSLQGNNYNLHLILDPHYFSSTSTATITIPATGINAKLTYDSSYSSNEPLSIVVIVLDALAILVLFGSIFSEKLIGLEMIQTLQIVMFAIPLMGSCPAPLSALQQLRYSNGYNFISGNDFYRTYQQTYSLSSIGIQQQFLLSYNLMYAILLSVVALTIIIKVVQVFYRRKLQKHRHKDPSQDKKLKIMIYKIKSTLSFVFSKVLFSVLFISLFQIVQGVSSQLNNITANYTLVLTSLNILGAIFALLIVAFMLSSVIVNTIYPQTLLHQFRIDSAVYPVYYLIYETFLIVLTSALYQQSWTIYLLLSLTVCNALIILTMRPYPEKFHHVVLLFQQVLLVFTLSIFLFEKLNPNSTSQNEGLFLVSCYVIIAGLFLVVLLSVVRLWMIKDYQPVNFQKNPQNPLLETNPDRQLSKAKGDNRRNKITKNTLNQSMPKNLEMKEYIEIDPIERFKKSARRHDQGQDFDWEYNQLDINQNGRKQANRMKAQKELSSKSILKRKNNGRPMQDNLQSQQEEADPLRIIKMKLKQDYDQKRRR